MKQALIVAASLAAGNFLYQAITGRDWGEAVKLSAFQAMTLAWFAWSNKGLTL